MTALAFGKVTKPDFSDGSSSLYVLYSDINCSGTPAGLSNVTTSVECGKYSLEDIILGYQDIRNTFLPPKSIKMYKGIFHLGYPSYHSIQPNDCYTFTSSDILMMESSLAGIGFTATSKPVDGSLCSNTASFPAPSYDVLYNNSASLRLYSTTGCQGVPVNVTHPLEECGDDILGFGLQYYANITHSRTPYLSVKPDAGSNLLIYSPNETWIRLDMNECYDLPVDILKDFVAALNSTYPLNHTLNTESRFCADKIVTSSGQMNLPILFSLVLALWFIGK
ncbi:hypothetical protein HDV04_005669 [Boothiomyces sp. JEL0838]|nr:hypothetical protein HDV04_005669 [Boothiomyces sp. JEL0838]